MIDAEWKANIEDRVARLEKAKRSADKRAKQKPAVIAEHRDIAKKILARYATIRRPAIDQSRPRAKRHILNLLKKYAPERLMRSVENYAIATAGKEGQYCIGVGNFFGRDQYWLEYEKEDWEMPDAESPEDKTSRKRYEAIGRPKP